MNKRYGIMVRHWIFFAIFSGVMLIAAGAAVYNKHIPYIHLILMAAGVVVIALSLLLKLKRRRVMEKYLDDVADIAGGVTSNIISAFPLPMSVINIDGSIRWYNDLFLQLFSGKDLFGMQIEDLIKDIKWGDVLKSASLIEKHVSINTGYYKVMARMVKERGLSDKTEIYSVYLYLLDETRQKEILKMYEDEKTDVASISIDNYDEAMQRIDDNVQEQIASKIRHIINIWAQDGKAVIKKIDRDRYFIVFDHKYLSQYIEDKFEILNSVRKLGEDVGAAVSISIGIGSGGSLIENEAYARSALEMTQGRGGDQVCIKTLDTYKFYGGKAKEYEKSNRVKTRAVAGAIKEFIKNSENVFFMGHSAADYDCFGAAMGLQRAVRFFKKQPYIIYDNNSPAIAPLYNKVKDIEDYDGMFINGSEARELISENSLLIILDTHRPSMLPCPELLKMTNKIIVIDHHRRSTEFINPCSLVYHEPYASSTCEMATELIEYMDIGSALTREEADSLYTGILMDTKNFIVKTGVRTFEAASYLRRLGLNPMAVKKLFNVNKADYDHKVDIVKTAVIIEPHVALAICAEQYSNIRVIASQASDEMLNIGDISASIVIYKMDGGFGLCARSIGDINVQLIMEQLGGGGHATVAGAQIRGKDLDEVVNMVKKAVKKCLN